MTIGTIASTRFDTKQAGMYACPADISSVATLALNSARAYYLRFVPHRQMTITLAAFAVTTASGTDDPCDVAIYDSTLANRLANVGATTGKLNTTGIKTMTFASALTLTPATVYFVAFGATSTATLAAVNLNSNNNAGLFGTSAPQAECLFLNSGYSTGLIAGPISPGGVISGAPLIALRES
jgi:hypothetical protein